MTTMMVERPQSQHMQCIEASKRIRWDIDRDVIRGRGFDLREKFLPDGLTLLDGVDFLSETERRLLSQIQGRTYANIFGLVERFINAKVLEISRDYWFEDQVALEALIRFSDEELKHQELFRRVEALCGFVMPDGYTFDWDANEIAGLVLGKSTWAVLALTLHIELFTQVHYRESIDGDPAASQLFKDIFKFHWLEESQHAILDELEFRRVDALMQPVDRDAAVGEFIDLVGAVDGLLQGQAALDADYFFGAIDRKLSETDTETVRNLLLRAYRWQYILSGAQNPRFQKVMGDVLAEKHGLRIQEALGTLQ